MEDTTESTGGDLHGDMLIDKVVRNMVNGVCDFCGSTYADRVLRLRPQRTEHRAFDFKEFRFCDRCFERFRAVVNGDGGVGGEVGGREKYPRTPLKP